jgi:amino acid permease
MLLLYLIVRSLLNVLVMCLLICVDLGVAVSYLIIIGDLTPQVVASLFPGAKSTPFLLDRHFWITAFMYDLLLTY